MLLFFLLYLILGLIAGFFAGVLGLGGGVIIVPSLFWLFTFQGFESAKNMHQAIATSLCILIFTSLASAATHFRKKKIIWDAFGWITLGTILGAILGPLTSLNVSPSILKIGLAIFEIMVGVYIFLQIRLNKIKKQGSEKPFKSPIFFIPFGLLIGYIGTLFGIGGGMFVVSVLILLRYSSHSAIATSSLCIVPLALVGTITYLYTALSNTHILLTDIINLPAFLITGSATLIGGPIGAHYCYKISSKTLKIVFSMLLIAIGCACFL